MGKKISPSSIPFRNYRKIKPNLYNLTRECDMVKKNCVEIGQVIIVVKIHIKCLNFICILEKITAIHLKTLNYKRVILLSKECKNDIIHGREIK